MTIKYLVHTSHKVGEDVQEAPDFGEFIGRCFDAYNHVIDAIEDSHCAELIAAVAEAEDSGDVHKHTAALKQLDARAHSILDANLRVAWNSYCSDVLTPAGLKPAVEILEATE